MLTLDLRSLSTGGAEVDVAVPGDSPVLAGLDLDLVEPLRVHGRLTESGQGQYYWHGSLEGRVAGSCRRCLAPVTMPLRADVGALFTEEDAVDDPSSYQIPVGAGELDLGPMVREELLLAAPGYLVCRDDCRGLCAHCGKDLNEGPCSCEPEPDPRWAALRALQGQEPDNQR
jgi:uncharacterized protein